jgi:hypothetical protein
MVRATDFVIREARQYKILTIHLKFERGGWSIYYIDEDSGSLLIMSDWGNYSYMWGHGGRGDKTLAQFLAGCSSEYIAEKLKPSRAKGAPIGWLGVLANQLVPALQGYLKEMIDAASRRPA